MSATGIQGSGTAAVTIADGTAAAQYTAATNAGFLQRLAIIAALVADSVIRENIQTSRVDYARQVLADPVAIVNRSIAYAITADGVTGPGSTDQAIANRLGDLWTTLATGY